MRVEWCFKTVKPCLKVWIGPFGAQLWLVCGVSGLVGKTPVVYISGFVDRCAGICVGISNCMLIIAW